MFQGGHDVAHVLEITSKFSQDELCALLRGIAEHSQERAKVSMHGLLPLVSKVSVWL